MSEGEKNINSGINNEGVRNEKADIKIVELAPDDWQKLKDLKLSSLEQEPIAFEDQEMGKERYLTRPEEEWRKILSGKLIGKEGDYINIFAKSKDWIVGMVAAVVPEEQDTEKKIATIHHMYVERGRRRGKIGKELLQTLLNKLKQRGDIEKAELIVVATQIPAFEMYKSLGFQETGRKMTKRGKDEYEEIEMEIKF